MAAAAGPQVLVVGLADFQRDLRAFDRAAPRALRTVNLRVAKVVEAPARARMAGLGGPGARVATTIRAGAQQRAATLAFGGPGAPMAGGMEFGAFRNIARQAVRNGKAITVLGWNQFRPWRGNRHTGALVDDIEFDGAPGGYAIHPAIRSRRTQIMDEYGDAFAAGFTGTSVRSVA